MDELFEGESVAAYNKRAWDRLAREGNRWTVPVSPETIVKARGGVLSLLLTPTMPVPQVWLGDVRGKHVLGLASAGGQQGPCLAAAGAVVTVIDNSPEQLSRDRDVASREGLALTTVEGDMRDLSAFKDDSFDLMFHPCSNCFVPDVRPVWREAHRVLKRGGHLLAGFVNPIIFALDLAKEREGIAQLKYKIPVSELDYPDDEEIRALHADGEPLSFGHTLEDQIGGQLDAGFQLISMFEDGKPDDPGPIHRLMKAYIATRAKKV
jgi:SAM-dependent methyltransferase